MLDYYATRPMLRMEGNLGDFVTKLVNSDSRLFLKSACVLAVELLSYLVTLVWEF